MKNILISTIICFVATGQLYAEQPEEVRQLYTSCDRGEAEECFRLGELYVGGLYGVGHDVSRGQMYITKGENIYVTKCDRGDAEACRIFGDRYMGQTYMSGNRSIFSYRNPTKAIEYYKKGCDKGDAESCTNLANKMNENGDYPEADRYYAKACDSGSMDSCIKLGIKYRDGQGVSPDRTLAAKYFTKGCNKGNAESCSGLRDIEARNAEDADKARRMQEAKEAEEARIIEENTIKTFSVLMDKLKKLDEPIMQEAIAKRGADNVLASIYCVQRLNETLASSMYIRLLPDGIYEKRSKFCEQLNVFSFAAHELISQYPNMDTKYLADNDFGSEYISGRQMDGFTYPFVGTLYAKIDKHSAIFKEPLKASTFFILTNLNDTSHIDKNSFYVGYVKSHQTNDSFILYSNGSIKKATLQDLTKCSEAGGILWGKACIHKDKNIGVQSLSIGETLIFTPVTKSSSKSKR